MLVCDKLENEEDEVTSENRAVYSPLVQPERVPFTEPKLFTFATAQRIRTNEIRTKHKEGSVSIFDAELSFERTSSPVTNLCGLAS